MKYCLPQFISATSCKKNYKSIINPFTTKVTFILIHIVSVFDKQSKHLFLRNKVFECMSI